MYIGDRQSSGSQYPGAAKSLDRLGWDGLSHEQFGQVGLPLPTVSAFRFRNTGTTDPENCCFNCTVNPPLTAGRINLGVGLRGNGAVSIRASNGMELAFTIAGHRPGIEYEITRTRRNSLWQRTAAGWTRLGTVPMGTGDDPPPDVDECKVLSASNRIFSEDRPGWRTINIPAPANTIFRSNLFGAPVATVVNAIEIVSRFSFAEWVISRSKAEGIPWTRLQLPPFRNGTARPHIYWHSTMWLVRNPVGSLAGQWVVGPRSEIELGPTLGAVINSAPA